ncbi:MAG: reductive dehalogenase [Caldilineaceae bacterium]
MPTAAPGQAQGSGTSKFGPQVDQSGPEVLDGFERFRQRNDIFSRAQWDASVRSAATDRFFDTYDGPLTLWRSAEGYTQKDYALRNASWHIKDQFSQFTEGAEYGEGAQQANTTLTEPAPTAMLVESPSAMSKEIKRAAKVLGAHIVGIADFDERWVYSHRYVRDGDRDEPIHLPEGLTHAIVLGIGMDYELTKTVPSALSGAATGMGYSLLAAALLSLAQHIRHLGYQAIPSLNDTALSIPLAIQAGLGEYGRNGMLITKEYGPRLRLGKIFTDLPLEADRPIHFGVREFCEVCERCSDACPVKALPHGPASDKALNISTITGVRKWSVDGERCFSFWASQNTDCSICIRVCPYNKDYSKWWHRMALRLAGSPLRKLVLKLDDWMGYGRRTKPNSWWARTK